MSEWVTYTKYFKTVLTAKFVVKTVLVEYCYYLNWLFTAETSFLNAKSQIYAVDQHYIKS